MLCTSREFALPAGAPIAVAGNRRSLSRKMEFKMNQEWHVALNKFNTIGSGNFQHWMYDAKSARGELPRLMRLFRAEREKTLSKVHKQCSQSDAVPIEENRLTCCLGTICRDCPYLKAIRLAKLTEEQCYEAMAWTCIGHILGESAKGHVDTSEGFILTEDDKMFWSNLYESLRGEQP